MPFFLDKRLRYGKFIKEFLKFQQVSLFYSKMPNISERRFIRFCETQENINIIE